MADKTVTLPDEDWLVIDQALQQMPYGRVYAVYGRMNPQFAAQNVPAEGTMSEDGLAARRVLREPATTSAS
jgi:hypothetical protein